MGLKLTIIESPYAAAPGTKPWLRWYDRWRNRRYLVRCLADSLARGEAPFASHGFYPQVLNDSDAAERLLGMKAGWAWMYAAECVAVYSDRGVSRGMLAGVKKARELGIKVEQRFLNTPLAREPDLG